MLIFRGQSLPADEWATLPQLSETPLSWGPFVLTEWVKGERLVFDRNEHWAGETGVSQIIIIYIEDTNQAVAQLLSGDVDMLERATLGGGAEVQTLIDQNTVKDRHHFVNAIGELVAAILDMHRGFAVRHVTAVDIGLTGHPQPLL